MSEPKRSRCAFVVVKLRIEGQDYLLMRRDRDWKDISFIGGHTSERDKGKLERTARRELLEEVPALRSFDRIELTPLTGEITHGPVYSLSARCPVLYQLRFLLLRFGDSPKPIVESLGPRTPNVLIRQADLVVSHKHRVAELVSVLANCIPGGLSSLPYSWPEDLGHSCYRLPGDQVEFSL